MITKKIQLSVLLIIVFISGSTQGLTASDNYTADKENMRCQDYEYISEYLKVFIASINTTAILERLNGPGFIQTLMEELD